MDSILATITSESGLFYRKIVVILGQSRLEQIISTQNIDHIHIYYAYYAFHALKHLNPNEIAALIIKLNKAKFSQFVIERLMEEKKTEAFKAAFPHSYPIDETFGTALFFIVQNQNELLSHSNQRPCTLIKFFESSCYHGSVYAYMTYLISISADMDIVMDSLRPYARFNLNEFYYDNIKFIKKPHQLALF